MTFFLHWVPTYAAGVVMLIAAGLLHVSIRRDERRQREARERAATNSPGGAPTA